MGGGHPRCGLRRRHAVWSTGFMVTPRLCGTPAEPSASGPALPIEAFMWVGVRHRADGTEALAVDEALLARVEGGR